MTPPELIELLCALCEQGFMPRGDGHDVCLRELEQLGLAERTLSGGWRPTQEGRRQAEILCCPRQRLRTAWVTGLSNNRVFAATRRVRSA